MQCTNLRSSIKKKTHGHNLPISMSITERLFYVSLKRRLNLLKRSAKTTSEGFIIEVYAALALSYLFGFFCLRDLVCLC